MKAKVKSKKLIALLGAAMLMMGSLAACGSEPATEQTIGQTTEQTETVDENATEAVTEEGTETDTAETTTEEPAAQEQTEVSGTVTMAGSTSMEKLANAVAEAMMEKYSGITVTAEFTGSGAGIEALIAGSVDIGNSSRDLKEEELAEGVVQNVVAIDGIAVVVDPANTVTDLTKEQLAGIYTGEITNWSELGGADEPIVVVGRESGSGTRSAFEELVEVEDVCAYANELDSTGAVIAKVASTPGAIGYASLDALDDSIIAVSLEGTAPTVDNIKAGNYFLSRPFVMATKGEIAEQSEAVQELFRFLESEEGKAVIEQVGLITVS